MVLTNFYAQTYKTTRNRILACAFRGQARKSVLYSFQCTKRPRCSLFYPWSREDIVLLAVPISFFCELQLPKYVHFLSVPHFESRWQLRGYHKSYLRTNDLNIYKACETYQGFDSDSCGNRWRRDNLFPCVTCASTRVRSRASDNALASPLGLRGRYAHKITFYSLSCKRDL
jgi:hypothetical protein